MISQWYNDQHSSSPFQWKENENPFLSQQQWMLFFVVWHRFYCQKHYSSLVLMPTQISSSMKYGTGANSLLSPYHAGPSQWSEQPLFLHNTGLDPTNLIHTNNLISFQQQRLTEFKSIAGGFQQLYLQAGWQKNIQIKCSTSLHPRVWHTRMKFISTHSTSLVICFNTWCYTQLLP